MRVNFIRETPEYEEFVKLLLLNELLIRLEWKNLQLSKWELLKKELLQFVSVKQVFFHKTFVELRLSKFDFNINESLISFDKRRGSNNSFV